MCLNPVYPLVLCATVCFSFGFAAHANSLLDKLNNPKRYDEYRNEESAKHIKNGEPGKIEDKNVKTSIIVSLQSSIDDVNHTKLGYKLTDKQGKFVGARGVRSVNGTVCEFNNSKEAICEYSVNTFTSVDPDAFGVKNSKLRSVVQTVIGSGDVFSKMRNELIYGERGWRILLSPEDFGLIVYGPIESKPHSSGPTPEECVALGSAGALIGCR